MQRNQILYSPFPLCLCAHALAILLMLASFVQAQRVSLSNEGRYVPGVHAPMTIDAEGPGVIRIRGPEMLGIDWDAPGKTSVVLPWMCWRTTPGEVEIDVNGQKQTLQLRPIGVEDQHLLTTPWTPTVSAIGPPSAMYNESAYIPTYNWTPGRSKSVRGWTVAAAIFVCLAMTLVTLIGWKSRWTPFAMLITAGVVTTAIVSNRTLARHDSILIANVRSSDPKQTDSWLFATSDRDERVRVAAAPSFAFVPRSPEHLSRVDPVAIYEPNGLAAMLTFQLGPRQFVALIGRTNADDVRLVGEDRVRSGEFVRKLYQRPFDYDENDVAILRPASSK